MGLFRGSAFILFLCFMLPLSVFAQDAAQVIGFDSTELTSSRDSFFSYIEGSVGTLIVVAAGVAAIISASMGMYAVSKTLMIAAVGTFIIKSVTLTFFPDQADEFKGIPPQGENSSGVSVLSGPPHAEAAPTEIPAPPSITQPPVAAAPPPAPTAAPTALPTKVAPTKIPTTKPTIKPTKVPAAPARTKTPTPRPTETPNRQTGCRVRDVIRDANGNVTYIQMKCVLVQKKPGQGPGRQICYVDGNYNSCEPKQYCHCVRPDAPMDVPDYFEVIDDYGNL